MTNPKDLQLVLHIGLHKTASTYLQNVLSARRYDLIEHGVLYPSTGMHPERPIRTRDGAQSGQAKFTGRTVGKQLLEDLLEEIPSTASTVLMSAEDFTHPRVSPAQHVERFSMFGSIKVLLVLRRQDVWIESLYKQSVDQHYYFESRAFGDYLAEEGPELLDFHTRFSPWRDLVGPEHFHVVSYDDVADGSAICRRLLEVAGVDVAALEPFPGVEVPRYDSIRPIDTLGLRVLNGLRLRNRDLRDRTARRIYDAAPAGDIALMTEEMREGVIKLCAPINERIEAEWFDAPVPGLRFGAEMRSTPASVPSSEETVRYVEDVLSLCTAARTQDDAEAEQARLAKAEKAGA